MVFWACHSFGIHEGTAAMVTHTRPTLSKSQHGGGMALEDPPQLKSYWQSVGVSRESFIFSGYCPCSNGWLCA